MTVFAAIPVKALAEGKSRLSPVLDAAGRAALNRRFLDHVLAITALVPGAARTVVVSADIEVLDAARAAGAMALAETVNGGLNGALAQARRKIEAQGATAMLVLAADLPLLTADDARALLSAARGGASVVIAPDRSGLGTNALLLSPPGVMDFRFGSGSLALHLAAAQRSGTAPVVVNRPGLAFDVDTPQDYASLAETAPGLCGFA